ncbi:unnamed protein product, partial [Heterosigma akashiwo]
LATTGVKAGPRRPLKMDSDDGRVTVSLNIKNVYDGGSVTKFELPLKGTRIQKLKEVIQQENPDRPEPRDQRIIFCGKICQDDAKISDIIAKMDLTDPQTFHLVLNRTPERRIQSQNSPLLGKSPSEYNVGRGES